MAHTMTWMRWLIGVSALLVGSAPAIAGPMPATVAASFSHTCAVTSGGGLSCWGDNTWRQLGDGTNTPRLTPVAVNGLPSAVAAVSTGSAHTCAVTSGGGAVCWGSNFYGGLGDGTTTSRSTPVAVSGLSSGVTAIVAGSVHTCALTTEGAVMCWGSNTFGQLGDGSRTHRLMPGMVAGLSSGVTAIAAGGSYTCAVTAAGALVCWGGNRAGALGDGTTTDRVTPVAVSGLSTGVTAVAASLTSDHTCAVTAAGAVVCWGANVSGQLGDGTTTPRLTPVAVNGLSSGVTAVAVGASHTCALTSRGGVVCWGANGFGGVGDGTTTSRLTPVSVRGLSSGVTAIATGDKHTCAVTAGGGVGCWGYNASGQVGDGTTVSRPLAVTAIVGAATTMGLERTSLVFGAVSDGVRFGSQTADQTVRLAQLIGGGTATWTAASTTPWLAVSPSSGSGAAMLTISTRFASGLTTSQTGDITLTFTGAATAVMSIRVTLNVVSRTASAPPFGSFDTPAGDGTVLAGSIALTGWTLDNIGVKQVELWRDLQPGETTPPGNSIPGDPRNGKIFIANATFVDNARPDIETLNPTTPANFRAGWGYLMLTWGLFGQGNGTYTFHAFAVDQEGNFTTIGTKTVLINNNSAAKPFGSIDTPAIGGDASGPNFGWALTPRVNGVATCKIQPSGVRYAIDSGQLQPVEYGDVRPDIAGAFAGFSNSAAAGGHALIDWSTLANGTHTIGWLITDDCGRVDGVGSRFFNVTTGTNVLASPANAGPDAAVRAAETESSEPLLVARGYGELPTVLGPAVGGARIVEVKQGDRIELRTPRGFETAYQLVSGQPRALPIGSTWDASSGTFYWQPAPAFLGTYRLVFSNGRERIGVRVVVVP